MTNFRVAVHPAATKNPDPGSPHSKCTAISILGPIVEIAVPELAFFNQVVLRTRKLQADRTTERTEIKKACWIDIDEQAALDNEALGIWSVIHGGPLDA
jgi:hypothetical protein